VRLVGLRTFCVFVPHLWQATIKPIAVAVEVLLGRYDLGIAIRRSAAEGIVVSVFDGFVFIFAGHAALPILFRSGKALAPKPFLYAALAGSSRMERIEMQFVGTA
jgi:hypothetical protein